ncbi:MBL fold metallo-hydrolase [Uliginosibacterium aquaticum]|uniref:MBL fold metallo-hydrolase n=1 Tax=Uliginosibacterium aquaticum TaxID=2731212 RepID=A0ABX2IB44_9RHOO|nr:MBL fold metallo-hydrolase [Uliginosibacterium aquaticum]NSL53594.1 MBL fold metallo-hydrolase [Uliginosibacterium aquaticum]
MALQYQIISVTPFQQNCSLIWCDQSMEAAVVDPGGDVARIEAAVARAGVKLTKILLTHGHLDHVGGSAELAARLALPIEGPQREDAFWIENLAEQCRMFGFPLVAGFTPTRWLEEGDRISLGQEVLEVIHTPGHTPGHVVLYSRSAQLALVGDVLFAGSIGRTDFPRGDHQALLDSIRLKLWPLGDDTRFIPGHGPMSSFGEERQSNPFVAD